MKTTLKARLIQHLLAKKNDKGFTLVELLVVVIIIGILSAIALPSLLNQSNKAKESEAAQYISNVNKAQGAYRTENTQFADNFNKLALGNLKDGTNAGTDDTSSKYYTYVIQNTDSDRAEINATIKDTALKAFAGAIVRYTNSENLSVTTDVTCKGDVPGADVDPVGITIDGTTDASDFCPADSSNPAAQ